MARLTRILACLAPLAALGAPAAAQQVATVVSHGYSLDGTKGVWVPGMAEAIVARAGGGAVLRYRQDSGAWELVSGTVSADQPVVLIFRWLEDFQKDGPDWGFAEAAGDALHAALREPVFVDGAGQPLPPLPIVGQRALHFIGHSRGTCVNSEAVRRLAVGEVQVDHVTTLDPHPVNGTLDPPISPDWGDPVPVTWSNVVFADNYWRADGGWFNAADFDGMPLPETLDTELDEGALECCGYSMSHSDTHLWYHGTIDLAESFCDGQVCLGPPRPAWWPQGYTERGYFYSILGGGSGMRPDPPPVGSAPGEVPVVYNGDFDEGSVAGWLYHGGGDDGAVVAEGGGWALELSAGGVGATVTRAHNRFWLPAGASSVRLDYRVISASGGADELVVVLRDLAGATADVGAIAPGEPGPWIIGEQLVIPPSIQRQRAYLLDLRLTSGGAGTASLRLDNVDVNIAPPCPGDTDGSGQVDVDDLTAVILDWGTDGSQFNGDVDGSGIVDVDDLTAVILAWGACP